MSRLRITIFALSLIISGSLVHAAAPIIQKILPSNQLIESPISYGVDILVYVENMNEKLSGYLNCPGNIRVDLNSTIRPYDQTVSILHLETRNETNNPHVDEDTVCILILDDDEDHYNTTVPVMFVTDPIIENILPLFTIQSGGIYQTITGKNFHNHRPVMAIDLACGDTEIKRIALTNCDNPTHNGTQFVCPIPDLWPQLENYPTCKITADRSRFTMRVIHGQPVIANLHVIEDPIVTKWASTRVFKPHKGQLGLQQKDGNHIQGIFPLNPPSTAYYTVTVGDETCTNIIISRINIMCELSGEKPEGVANDDGSYKVKVILGGWDGEAGNLKYELTAFEDPSFKYGVIGGVCGFVVLIVIVALLIWILRRRRADKKDNEALIGLQDQEKRRRIYVDGVQGQQDLWSVLSEELRDNLKAFHKFKERINGPDIPGNKLGEGHFGTVYKGTYRKDDGNIIVVAIKTCKGHSNHSDKVDFLEEAAIMREFNHPNVLGLIAVIIDRNKPFIVIPLMANGDLKHYVKDRKNDIKVRQLMGFSLDIARGMSYLGNLKFVHRDLSAKNIMLDDQLRAVVADFGLARDIYVKDYYRVEDRTRPLPIKFMAIETLFGGAFTTASDVWSFGIVMWELMTRGLRLYADTPGHDLKFRLQSGHRLNKPPYAPQEIYNLMLYCWVAEPSKRPTFTDIVTYMEDLLDEDSILRNLSVKVGFRRTSLSNSSDYDDVTGSTGNTGYSDYLRLLGQAPPVPMGEEE